MLGKGFFIGLYFTGMSRLSRAPATAKHRHWILLMYMRTQMQKEKSLIVQSNKNATYQERGSVQTLSEKRRLRCRGIRRKSPPPSSCTCHFKTVAVVRSFSLKSLSVSLRFLGSKLKFYVAIFAFCIISGWIHLLSTAVENQLHRFAQKSKSQTN